MKASRHRGPAEHGLMRLIALTACVFSLAACDTLLGPAHEVVIRLDNPGAAAPAQPASDADRMDAVKLLETRLRESGGARVRSEAVTGDPRQVRIYYRGKVPVQQARRLLGTAGHLEFRLVTDGLAHASADEARASFSGVLPPGVSLAQSAAGEDHPNPAWYAVGPPVLTDCDLQSAAATVDGAGRRAVGFTFKKEAGERFRKLTRENISRQLAILYNDRVMTAPIIQSEIGADGIINGNFTQEEVAAMVAQLKTGCMPLTPVILSIK